MHYTATNGGLTDVPHPEYDEGWILLLLVFIIIAATMIIVTDFITFITFIYRYYCHSHFCWISIGTV